MKNKNIVYIIIGLVCMLIFLALIFLIKIFFSTISATSIQFQNNVNTFNNRNSEILNNTNINNDPGYDPLKKYKIDYSIKPKVMFNSGNSEIINFETNVNTKYEITYGRTSQNEKNIKDDILQTSHEVVLNNLEPNSRYYYNIKIYSDNGGYNEEFSSSFTTQSSIIYNYAFAVMGDSRPVTGFIMPKEFNEIIKNVAKANVNFAIITGDMVQLSDIEKITIDRVNEAWKNFTDAVSPVSSKIPVYLTVGNHDEPANTIALQRFRDIWTFPHNGGGKTGWYDELTYWFSYANSLFIVVNSEEPGFNGSMSPEQYLWLQKILSYDNYDHKFVFTHNPIAGSTRGVNSRSNELHSLFMEKNVSAIFTGHDHVYCKYKKNGLYYIITGGAGSPLYNDLCAGTEISQFHYVTVEVEGQTITIRAFSKDNSLLDSFSINDNKD